MNPTKFDELNKLATRIRNEFFREVEMALIRLLVAETPIKDLVLIEETGRPWKKTVWSRTLNRGYILEVKWPDLNVTISNPSHDQHFVSVTCTETFEEPFIVNGWAPFTIDGQDPSSFFEKLENSNEPS